jgi:hypothetical protein
MALWWNSQARISPRLENSGLVSSRWRVEPVAVAVEPQGLGGQGDVSSRNQ